MFENILKNPFSSDKVLTHVLADLRRRLKAGHHVAFVHQEQMVGKAMVVAIKDHYLLFEPLDPIKELMTASIVSNLGEGTPWEFSIKDMQKVIEGSDTYLQCAIPAKINTNSRRENFRISPPRGSGLELHFHVNETLIIAKILDLSATGAKIRLDNTKELRERFDQVINGAALVLGTDDSVKLDFHLCWSAGSDKALSAGVEFLSLSPADSDHIYHAVCGIEREVIRQSKSLD